MAHTENNDNRHYHRILYSADATLSCEEKTWTCVITDLSLKGCMLEFDSAWEGDQEKLYSLSLHLSEETLIKMELAPMRVVGNKVGFKCVHIDIDSISELRRLVELNLGNSSLLERDLQALTG